MKFSSFYVIYVWAAFALSTGFNALLLLLVHRKRNRVDGIKYFSVILGLLDIIYSLVYAALAPDCYVRPGMFVFYPLSPFSASNDVLMDILQHLWFGLFAITMMIIGAQFFYRYSLLCSPLVRTFFEKPLRLILIIVANGIILAIFLTAAEWYLCTPPGLREKMIAIELSKSEQQDFSTIYIHGMDFEFVPVSTIIRATIILLTTIGFYSGLIVFSGVRINRSISTSIMSNRAKRMHSNALRLLITEVDVEYGEFVQRGLLCFFGLYPILNPLMIICLTQDYRRTIMGRSSISPMTEGLPSVNPTATSRPMKLSIPRPPIVTTLK